MSAGDQWLTWPQAADLVGCPVPTIDWHTRNGRIASRPHHGPRPTLRRESVEEFAIWWRAEQARRVSARASPAAQPREPQAPPPGWVLVDQAAKQLGRTRSYVRRLLTEGDLVGERRSHGWWVQQTGLTAYLEKRERWVSMATAAAIAGCSPRTIQRALERGELERRQGSGPAVASVDRRSVEEWGHRWHASHRPRPKRSTAPRPPDSEHDWLDSSRAAGLLGLSAGRVRQLARADRIPYEISDGRRWFRRDLVELVARARQARPVES